jgi:HD-GYP domain-containing protein (c-di-GMP phosphodiesterase class II)
MYVSAEVLNKPGALRDSEWAARKAHPLKGVEHLRKHGVNDQLVLRVTGEHHERLDGTGYPSRVLGNQIHLSSKICSVIDSFDAMTSCRPFKNKVRTIAEAVEVLRSECPTKYDPASGHLRGTRNGKPFWAAPLIEGPKPSKSCEPMPVA